MSVKKKKIFCMTIGRLFFTFQYSHDRRRWPGLQKTRGYLYEIVPCNERKRVSSVDFVLSFHSTAGCALVVFFL